jgi:hypothetical protein
VHPKGIGPERKVRDREVPPQFTKLMKVAWRQMLFSVLL